MAIVVGVVMERLMGKRTENDENLKKYQARLEELKAEGNLVPSPNLPDDKLIVHLAAEGEKLLKAEGIKSQDVKITFKGKTAKAQEKLEEKLGSSSANPYVRARIMVLKKYPEWRRNELRDMEQTGNINNKFYDEFVHEVAILGDTLSNEKK